LVTQSFGGRKRRMLRPVILNYAELNKRAGIGLSQQAQLNY
jgi:hypothetical protein